MALAVGATGLVPWLAIEMAAELAGSRGAEELDAAATVGNLLAAFDAGLRKTLARMGISTASSYIGGKLFETIELDDDVRRALLPVRAGVARPGWFCRPRRATASSTRRRARGQSRQRRRTSSRTRASPASGPTARSTCYAPKIVAEIQAASGFAPCTDGAPNRAPRRPAASWRPVRQSSVTRSASAGRAARRRSRSTRSSPPASIARRFVVGGDVGRRALARGAPGADDRHPARRRCREHRRGRRGSGLVRAEPRRRAPRRPDQAGRLGPLRRHRDLPRPRRAARDQDRPGLEARRGRPAAREEGDRLDRGAPPRPARA